MKQRDRSACDRTTALYHFLALDLACFFNGVFVKILHRMGLWSGLAAALLLVGCATTVQQPVSLSTDYFAIAKQRDNRVGVVMSELPKPDTAFPGAGCLLCIAVANAAHASMSKEVQSFSTTELKPLPGELVSLLKKQGIDAVLIDEPLKTSDLPDLRANDTTNKARKDYSALKSKYKIDRLLVVDVTALGVWRSYSAYVPTQVPRAVIYGSASLVDLSTHNLEWFLPMAFSRSTDGPWDEPPKFPGLTNAYYQVLETAMDSVKKPFVR